MTATRLVSVEGLREAVLALPGRCHDGEGLGCEVFDADGYCAENVARSDVLALFAALPAAPAEAGLVQPPDLGLPPSAPTSDPFRWSWDGIRWNDAWLPAEAGLRAALERIARRMEDWETECRREGVWRATSPDALMSVWMKEQARAALAAQEGAGE